jgi:hypothetical protein
VFYYTYSTIAAILTGFFCILIASSNNRINYLSDKHKNILMNTVPEMKSAASQPDRTQRTNDLNMILRKLVDCEQDKVRSKRVLRHSLSWTGGTIIACLIFMPMTPKLASSALWVLLVVVVAAAVYTITRYGVQLVEVAE